MNDKVKHFLVCFVVSMYSTEMAFAMALTKEWCDVDVYGGNTRNESRMDFLADTVGMLLGTIVRMLVIRRWNWF